MSGQLVDRIGPVYVSGDDVDWMPIQSIMKLQGCALWSCTDTASVVMMSVCFAIQLFAISSIAAWYLNLMI